MKWTAVGGSQNHHLFKRGSSPFYWIRFSRAGKPRLEKSLKTDKLGEARIQRDLEIAAYTGKKASFMGVKLVDERFEEWIVLMSIKSAGTVASIKAQWSNHLKPHFGRMNLDEVTSNEWLRYVSKKREIAPDRKFFNDRKWLSMFMLWAQNSGYCEKAPKFEDVDPERARGKVFSDDEIDALLLNADLDLHLQILMGFTMGMRIGEILSLEWSQISFDKRTIWLPAAKTKIRKERTFGVSKEVFNVLQSRRERSTSRWVFPSPRNPDSPVGRQGNKSAWDSCRRKSGVVGKFHHLRHTFLTRAFKHAVNPALICEYAGLSMDEAQRTYLHFSVEDSRVVADLISY